MMRKPWDQLSPAYRRRLEHAGISKQDHESGKSIRAARGHGLHTPSSRRHMMEVRQRRHDRMTSKELVRREQLLGYIKLDSVVNMLDELGVDRAATVLAWQEYRHHAWEDAHEAAIGASLVTLPEYVGDDWDDTYDNWYDDAIEADEGFSYYHETT